ncbi:MAG TPA: hypothetical protein VF288_09785 [Mycobacteriales bacterium]
MIADARRAVWMTAFLAPLGAGLGFVAAALTPHLGSGLYVDPQFVSAYAVEDKAVFGGDGVMIAVLAASGVLLGLASLRGRDDRPVGTVLGVLAGGIAAGLVAMAVDHLVLHQANAAPTRRLLAQMGGEVQLRPYVRGSADFLVLPLFGLVVFLLGNARWLVRSRRRVSSGTAAPS